MILEREENKKKGKRKKSWGYEGFYFDLNKAYRGLKILFAVKKEKGKENVWKNGGW